MGADEPDGPIGFPPVGSVRVDPEHDWGEWVHVWLIWPSDPAVVAARIAAGQTPWDVLMSPYTAPTIPTGYSHFAKLGEVTTDRSGRLPKPPSYGDRDARRQPGAGCG